MTLITSKCPLAIRDISIKRSNMFLAEGKAMLRHRIERMACKNCPDEKTVYRVMDLEIIKYNGIKQGFLKIDDELCAVIDRLIHQFLWLHDKGLSTQSRINDVFEMLESSDDKEIYQQFMSDCAKLNEFVKMHASLKEGI